MSRAFTFSGVKSCVYSVWRVPDKETSEIMISFYENLKKGQAKDEALSNAKNTFLRNNPMKQHPFFWAGFVVNGDVQSINKNTSLIVYFGIAILIGMVVFFIRKGLLNKYKIAS